MKTHLFTCTLLAAALSTSAIAADERPLREKTADALQTAGEKTKEAGRVVVETSKDVGQAVVDGSRKALDTLKDTIHPEPDARRVNVTLTDQRIDVPTEMAAGKTAFVVRNSTTTKQNLQVVGGGMEKQFHSAVEPNETKTLHVDLKPGTYQVKHPDRVGAGTTITVK